MYFTAYYELRFYSEASLPEVSLFVFLPDFMFLNGEDFLTVSPTQFVIHIWLHV